MQFVAMFLDEGKLTARLNHPNIVKVYEQANEGGSLFIAMELLFGQSLVHVWDAMQSRRAKLPYEVVAWIGARVADGLHHAHELRDERGVSLEVVHRDVNPSNVFVTYGGQVKIIDFGLAKALDRLTSTVAGIVKGKLAYMSPEQIDGLGVDRRSDVFSLGTTLWEVTCDRRLFKRDNDAETMIKVQAAEVPDPAQLVPGYPPELAQVLKNALTRDRTKRYPTAAELAKELDSFAGMGGRIVTPGTVMEIMGELFPKERDRDARWFEGAGQPITTVPLAPLRLPSEELHTVYGEEALKPEELVLPPEDLVSEVAAPAVVAAHSPKNEPSEIGRVAGVPTGTFAALSTGELALLGALGMLVIVAIIVAVMTLSN